MPDVSAAPSLWTILLSVVGGGTAMGLLNAYLNRGTPRHTQLLLGAQTERERAEARKVEVEADLAVARGAFELLDRVEAESKRKDAEIEKLKAERDALERQIELIKAERKLGNGKGN
jgi:cell division protein FtsB